MLEIQPRHERGAIAIGDVLELLIDHVKGRPRTRGRLLMLMGPTWETDLFEAWETCGPALLVLVEQRLGVALPEQLPSL
jgi:hypothetical protein